MRDALVKFRIYSVVFRLFANSLNYLLQTQIKVLNFYYISFLVQNFLIVFSFKSKGFTIGFELTLGLTWKTKRPTLRIMKFIR